MYLFPSLLLELSSLWPARRGGNTQRSARCVLYTSSLLMGFDASYRTGGGKVHRSPKIFSRCDHQFGFRCVPLLYIGARNGGRMMGATNDTELSVGCLPVLFVSRICSSGGYSTQADLLPWGPYQQMACTLTISFAPSSWDVPPKTLKSSRSPWAHSNASSPSAPFHFPHSLLSSRP